MTFCIIDSFEIIDVEKGDAEGRSIFGLEIVYRMVLWLGESGNIIWRLSLGARAPANVCKILDVTQSCSLQLSPLIRTF